MRAITSRMSTGRFMSSVITPSSSDGSSRGGRAGCAGSVATVGQSRLATMSRAVAMACSSSSARYSARPLTVACRSAPPSSSSVAISPVAAFSSGGPARKARARLRTITT
ncbi:hypothetical protein D9M72_300840 [compost metagenome]